MPGFVVDASATLPWGFEDEASAWSEALLDRAEGGESVLVPAHWPIEVANALLMARRRGRITTEQASEFCKDLAALTVLVEPAYPPSKWPAVIALAERHGLTVYDAAYLEGALRSGFPLATLDRALERAARAAKVALVERRP